MIGKSQSDSITTATRAGMPFVRDEKSVDHCSELQAVMSNVDDMELVDFKDLSTGIFEKSFKTMPTLQGGHLRTCPVRLKIFQRTTSWYVVLLAGTMSKWLLFFPRSKQNTTSRYLTRRTLENRLTS